MPERNEPCPCGSGKKYKRCCALKGEGAAESLLRNPVVWIGAAVMVVALVVFLNWGGSGGSSLGAVGTTFYDESTLPFVDFSGLSQPAKEEVLEDINGRSCSCGCGLTLAQCVVTDPNCPLRASNIEQIRELIGAVPPVG